MKLEFPITGERMPKEKKSTGKTGLELFTAF